MAEGDKLAVFSIKSPVRTSAFPLGAMIDSIGRFHLEDFLLRFYCKLDDKWLNNTEDFLRIILEKKVARFFRGITEERIMKMLKNFEMATVEWKKKCLLLHLQGVDRVNDETTLFVLGVFFTGNGEEKNEMKARIEITVSDVQIEIVKIEMDNLFNVNRAEKTALKRGHGVEKWIISNSLGIVLEARNRNGYKRPVTARIDINSDTDLSSVYIESFSENGYKILSSSIPPRMTRKRRRNASSGHKLEFVNFIKQE